MQTIPRGEALFFLTAWVYGLVQMNTQCRGKLDRLALVTRMNMPMVISFDLVDWVHRSSIYLNDFGIDKKEKGDSVLPRLCRYRQRSALITNTLRFA